MSVTENIEPDCDEYFEISEDFSDIEYSCPDCGNQNPYSNGMIRTETGFVDCELCLKTVDFFAENEL
jgi:predicted RNA-binding Zn-ribbon protein involved in translation (DUF1610 family)